MSSTNSQRGEKIPGASCSVRWRGCAQHHSGFLGNRDPHDAQCQRSMLSAQINQGHFAAFVLKARPGLLPGFGWWCGWVQVRGRAGCWRLAERGVNHSHSVLWENSASLHTEIHRKSQQNAFQFPLWRGKLPQWQLTAASSYLPKQINSILLPHFSSAPELLLFLVYSLTFGQYWSRNQKTPQQ